MRVLTGGSGICISHSCSECVFFFFLNNTSENPHFPFPQGSSRPGERGGRGVLVTLWFLRQNPDFL